MNNGARILFFAGAFLLLFSACFTVSCGKRNPNAVPVDNHKYDGFVDDPVVNSCSFMAFGSDGHGYMSASSPFTFTVSILLIGNAFFNRQYEPREFTVEVDFSDGTGWHDYTTETLEYYRDEREWSEMPTYTLNEPGEYFVHVRVTFPDDEVIDNEDVFPAIGQTITIVSPGEGDGA